MIDARSIKEKNRRRIPETFCNPRASSPSPRHPWRKKRILSFDIKLYDHFNSNPFFLNLTLSMFFTCAIPLSTKILASGLMSKRALLYVFVTSRLPPVSGDDWSNFPTPGPFHFWTALSSSSVIPTSWRNWTRPRGVARMSSCGSADTRRCRQREFDPSRGFPQLTWSPGTCYKEN